MAELKSDLGLATVRFISGVDTDRVIPRREEQPLDSLVATDPSAISKFRAAWRKEKVGEDPFTVAAVKPQKPVEVAVFLALEQKYGERVPSLFEKARSKAQERDSSRTSRRYYASPLRELIRLAKVGAASGESDKELRQQHASIYAEALTDVRRHLRGKFGIELTFVDNDEIAHLNVRQVSSPAYFGFSRQNISEELYPLVLATGGCAIVISSDNKLVVQIRDPKANAQYGGMFGASIAGMFDATNAVSDHALYERAFNKPHQGHAERRATFDPSLHAPGMVDEIDDAAVLQHIKREGREELGIKDTLTDLTVVGIAFDARMPHHELIGLGRTSQSSEALLKRARENHAKNASKYHFAEQAIVIEASPESIAKLLCDIRSPLPPTHAAAFLCAGTRLMRLTEGDDAAATYFEATSRRLQENYERIDLMCKKTTGQPYNPRLSTVEQGLPDPLSEARRVGLL